MKRIFLDLETTGLKCGTHGIWQIGALVEIDGQVKQGLNLTTSPYDDEVCDPEALALSSVTESEVRGYSDPLDTHKALIQFLGSFVDRYNKKDKLVMVGYNCLSFDSQFLRHWFSRARDKYYGAWFWVPPVDVFPLAMYALQYRRATLPNFKLPTVAAALGIPVKEEELHDAYGHAQLVYQLYKTLEAHLPCGLHRP